jgi:hypothetical protein
MSGEEWTADEKKVDDYLDRDPRWRYEESGSISLS